MPMPPYIYIKLATESQQSSETQSLHLIFGGLQKIVACSQSALQLLSCIYLQFLAWCHPYMYDVPAIDGRVEVVVYQCVDVISLQGWYD